jgi:hypothetical protein
MTRAGFFKMAVVMIACFCTHAHAGEWDTKSDVRIRRGMKVIKAGDANILVPKGGTTYRDDEGRIYMESSDEYAARGFTDTDDRFKTAEVEIAELKDRVKTLEDKLGEATKRLKELEKNKPEKET